MKILVNNQDEANMAEEFLTALHEEMLDYIQEQDHTQSDSKGMYLSSDQYDFLRDGIYHAEVIINNTVREMVIEPYNICGICSKCGTNTSGTIDGNDISYSEYLDMMSEDRLKSWLCETCWYKNIED